MILNYYGRKIKVFKEVDENIFISGYYLDNGIDISEEILIELNDNIDEAKQSQVWDS